MSFKLSLIFLTAAFISSYFDRETTILNFEFLNEKEREYFNLSLDKKLKIYVTIFIRKPSFSKYPINLINKAPVIAKK